MNEVWNRLVRQIRWKESTKVVTICMVAVFSLNLRAIEFEYHGLNGSWDTTLSYGVRLRTEKRDKELIGIANGGRAFSVNSDDGNLNYSTGLISNAFKTTSEIELNYKKIGAFVRGLAFYDIENEDGNRARNKLSSRARERVGSDIQLLDAYLTMNFDTIIGRPFELRVGEQVISWGEGTFFQNSINTINPINVSALRVPGAELREALLPEGLIWGSFGSTDDVTIEAFFQYDHDTTEIDPPGTYFSTNDFVGDGGSRVILGSGRIPDNVDTGSGLNPPIGVVVPRAADDRPSDSGQYGVAIRIFLPEFYDTEFGLYYINYHSRLPIFNVRSGSAAGLGAGDYSGSVQYFIGYPEDIQLYGISFNTLLQHSGIALQGEVSHRRNVPLQIDGVELLIAGLSPVTTIPSQLGTVGFETLIPGFIKRNVTQFQLTATKVFGPTWGANTFVMFGEAALSYIHSMPDKADLRLESPGTFVGGDPRYVALGLSPATESSKHFADSTSWGYRVVALLNYTNVIGAINLTPRISWQHDVSGNSPGPGGNFLENRKAITIGMGADYQNSWEATFSYTNYFGAGRYNLTRDRDFVEFNVKYSF